MKFKETFVLQRVYFNDPEGKLSGTGYIRCRSGDSKDHTIEVMLDKQFLGFRSGRPACLVHKRPVDTYASSLTPRGRVYAFVDSDGLNPIYAAWPA
jgi:hypothetical protein